MKKNKKKTAKIEIMKMFAGMAALAIFLMSVLLIFEFCTPYKLSNAFQKPNKPPLPEEQTEQLITPERVQGNGMMLLSARIATDEYSEYGVVQDAKEALTLTAVLTPEDATDDSVSWTVRWKNAESAWAKGKDVRGYLSLTPNGFGAKSAVLAFLKAFGEPIEVEAKSSSNTEKYVVMQNDCLSVIDTTDPNIVPGLNVCVNHEGEELSLNTINFGGTSEIYTTVFIKWTDGTIRPEVQIKKFDLSFLSDYITYCKNPNKNMYAEEFTACNFTRNTVELTNVADFKSNFTREAFDNLLTSGNPSLTKNEQFNVLYKTIMRTSTLPDNQSGKYNHMVQLTAHLEFTYGERVLSTLQISRNYFINVGAFKIEVDGIEFEDELDKIVWYPGNL
jgi:hypothetical protein